jgi:predicted phage terminase large subunit-like protein
MTAAVLDEFTEDEIVELCAEMSLAERAEFMRLMSGSVMTDGALVPPFVPGAFLRFCQRINPKFNTEWAYVRYLAEQLEAVARGEYDRMMNFMPPQWGKTWLASVYFPVWLLSLNPSLRIIVGSYNKEHARRISGWAREAARGILDIRSDSKAKNEWALEEGGSFLAVGVGGGTGNPCDVLILDDLFKGRKEAESEVMRETVWEWWQGSLYPRLAPHSAVIMQNTRWHHDDHVGRLLEMEKQGGDKWVVNKIPCFSEGEGDPLGRPAGQTAVPGRYSQRKMERKRANTGDYEWEAIYQQNPSPRQGGMFKRDKFQILDALPAGCRFIRFWDKAATEGGGDFSVGVLMALASDSTYWVCDVVRGQWGEAALDNIIRQTAELDRINYGFVHTRGEEEGGASGKRDAAAFIRLLNGFSVDTERAVERGSKTTNASAYASQQQVGNVKLLRGTWNGVFINEHCAFPTGKNDDQVDAGAGCFNWLASQVFMGGNAI